MENPRNEPAVHDRSVWALVAGNVAVLAALAGYLVFSVGRIPDRYAVHFSDSGKPDRWVAADASQWLMLPALAAVLALALIALALALPHRRLYLVGMPQRARFEALPWAEQAPLIRSLVRLLLTIALVNTCALGALEVALFGDGAQLPQPLDLAPVLLVALVYPLIAIPWILALRRRMARALA